MSNPANSLNIKAAGIPVFDGVATFTESTTTQHNVLIGGASNAIANVAPSATSGVPLISQGASSDPAFGTAVVAGGGTGAVSFTAHGVLLGEGTSPIGVTAAGTTGQVLTGVTGSDPIWASLASGGISTLVADDAGTATGSSVTIAGGSNINTTAASSTLTVNLDSTVSIAGSMTAGTGFIATTGGVSVLAGNIDLPTTTAGLADGAILINGSEFMHAYGTHNTFLGTDSGNGSLTTASATDNTGLGFGALLSIATGRRNTAVGSGALENLDATDENTAVGFDALNSANTAAAQNTAIGHQALSSLGASGSNNTALGWRALLSVATGSNNIALGASAAINLDTSDSNNIMIGNGGTSGDNHKIIIGTQGSGSGQQNECFIAGIFGVSQGGTINMATINSSGQLGSQSIPSGGLPWTDVTSGSQALAVNNGYIADFATLITATLPALAAQGSIIAIVGNAVGGWLIAQNSGQTIHFGSSNTTTGASGSLASTLRYDCVELLCTVANTDFVVRSSVGNLTVT